MVWVTSGGVTTAATRLSAGPAGDGVAVEERKSDKATTAARRGGDDDNCGSVDKGDARLDVMKHERRHLQR